MLKISSRPWLPCFALALAAAGPLACDGQSPEPGKKSQAAAQPAEAKASAGASATAAVSAETKTASVQAAKRKPKKNEAMLKAAEGALAVGAKAPSFALPDALGETVSLAKLVEKGSAVLVFYRGHW